MVLFSFFIYFGFFSYCEWVLGFWCLDKVVALLGLSGVLLFSVSRSVGIKVGFF